MALRVGDLVLNPATFEAWRAGKEIALTRREFRLLEVLMRRSGCVVSRNALAHSLWDPNDDESDNLIDDSVYQLRRKKWHVSEIGLRNSRPSEGTITFVIRLSLIKGRGERPFEPARPRRIASLHRTFSVVIHRACRQMSLC